MSGSIPGQRRGGRQKGAKNKTTINRMRATFLPGSRWQIPEYYITKIAKPLPEWVCELLPVDCMLYAMRAAFAAKHYMVAADLASKVAPYVHPRLMAAQVEHSGKLTLEQLVMELMEQPVAQTMIEGDVVTPDGSSTAAEVVAAEIEAGPGYETKIESLPEYEARLARNAKQRIKRGQWPSSNRDTDRAGDTAPAADDSTDWPPGDDDGPIIQ